MCWFPHPWPYLRGSRRGRLTPGRRSGGFAPSASVVVGAGLVPALNESGYCSVGVWGRSPPVPVSGLGNATGLQKNRDTSIFQPMELGDVAISVPLSCHCERSAAIRLALSCHCESRPVGTWQSGSHSIGISSALRASQRQIGWGRRPQNPEQIASAARASQRQMKADCPPRFEKCRENR